MSRKYIVTGALGALGQAVSAKLRSDGHAVCGIDLAQAMSASTGETIGGVDLTDEAAVAAAYASAMEILGGLDGVANVAGGFLWETIVDGAVASWDRMYAMNVRTALISSRAALAHLSAGGSIVNIGAAAAQNAAAGMGSYAASKAGVMALTESLADELRGCQVRVNAVLPTILDTPQNRADMPDADVSGWVTLDAAASAIAFLLSPAAAAITGTGVKLSLGTAS